MPACWHDRRTLPVSRSVARKTASHSPADRFLGVESGRSAGASLSGGSGIGGHLLSSHRRGEGQQEALVAQVLVALTLFEGGPQLEDRPEALLDPLEECLHGLDVLGGAVKDQ